MDPISLALTAISGIRLLLSNPALGGGGSVRASEASELLGLLGTLISEGDDALDDLRAFAEQVEAMAAAGRGPSPTEWSALRERSDAAHAALQEIKEELLGQEEEETTPEPVAEVEAPTTEPETGAEPEEPVAPV